MLVSEEDSELVLVVLKLTPSLLSEELEVLASVDSPEWAWAVWAAWAVWEEWEAWTPRWSNRRSTTPRLKR